MADILANVLVDLKQIRKYLVKIGAKRRQKDICSKKLSEATAIYNEYLHTYDFLSKEISSSKIGGRYIII